MSTLFEMTPVSFKASDNGDSRQSIGTLENGPVGNKYLHDRLNVRLWLKPGMTFEQAESLADYLNQYVTDISVDEI